MKTVLKFILGFIMLAYCIPLFIIAILLSIYRWGGVHISGFWDATLQAIDNLIGIK